MVTVDQVHVFAECPYQIKMGNYEQTGLDVIFYGQDHYDTMAIISERQQPKQDEIGQLVAEQKLLSNKDLLARNFAEVIQNLEECDAYIEGVIVSARAREANFVCVAGERRPR